MIAGDTDKLVELLLDGYDHITDIVDDEDIPIIEAVSKANQHDTVSFLQSILAFEVRPNFPFFIYSFPKLSTLFSGETWTSSSRYSTRQL